ncbi:MAG: hypothetical protein HY060_08635 [Proteobacteria bacterium]|nr:hypothetical protein [Pseudomonadota bacterium]
MVVVGEAPGIVEIRLSVDELTVLDNALNEVCNGVHIDELEFQTRWAGIVRGYGRCSLPLAVLQRPN